MIFHDFSWFFMNFHDFSWFFLIVVNFHDFSIFSWIFMIRKSGNLKIRKSENMKIWKSWNPRLESLEISQQEYITPHPAIHIIRPDFSWYFLNFLNFHSEILFRRAWRPETFIPEGNPQTPYQPLTSSLNLKPETFNPQGAKINFIKMSKYLEPIQSIYPQTGIQNDIQVSNLSQNE